MCERVWGGVRVSEDVVIREVNGDVGMGRTE